VRKSARLPESDASALSVTENTEIAGNVSAEELLDSSAEI
jgi:hypothetical protein